MVQERIAQNAGRLKTPMIVALARRLLVALWGIASSGVAIEGAIMKCAKPEGAYETQIQILRHDPGLTDPGERTGDPFGLQMPILSLVPFSGPVLVDCRTQPLPLLGHSTYSGRSPRYKFRLNDPQLFLYRGLVKHQS